MNRLILIGNGFDLAHGLKTDYNSFILWYLKKCLNISFSRNMIGSNYEDDLLTVNYRYPGYSFGINGATESISSLVDYYYVEGLDHLFNDEKLYMKKGYSSLNPFKVTVKSKLFNGLISKCSNLNWVDI